MTTTDDVKEAARFDRFSNDLGAMLKSFRKLVPTIKREKLKKENSFEPDLYVFWYINEDQVKTYIK